MCALQVPTTTVQDNGFKGVLQLKDKVTIKNGDTETTMPVSKYLDPSQYKGSDVADMSAAERLDRLVKQGDFLTSDSISRRVNQLSGSQAKPIPVVESIDDKGRGGNLEKTDKVTIRIGKRVETMTVEKYVTSSNYAASGRPSERLAQLSRREPGYTPSPSLSDTAQLYESMTPQVHGVEDSTGEGILQASDKVTVSDGNGKEIKTITVKEFIRSSKYAYFGKPSERLEKIAGLNEHHISDALRAAARNLNQLVIQTPNSQQGWKTF